MCHLINLKLSTLQIFIALTLHMSAIRIVIGKKQGFDKVKTHHPGTLH